MRKGAEWIYKVITVNFATNINYHASAAAALLLVGNYDGNEAYKKRAKELAESCENHILEDGYLYGEGKPMEMVTARGCRPVDIGYNAEESIPSLLTYARAARDEVLLGKIKKLLKKQLDFMMPDGAWDNSFGTRNFKWTYWGSRTSDGCQTAYGTWGEEEPLFSEAAARNLDLLKACTYDGLLYGGPDYLVHGESPCLHHTFCHAKAMAGMLDAGGMERKSRLYSLPLENRQGIFHYPAVDTYKINCGGFLATVTACDFEYMKGGHASGGTLSMLWHKKTGPLLLSSMTDYSLHEAHNMQLSVRKLCHQPLTVRVERLQNEQRFSQCYDYDAEISTKQDAGCCDVIVRSTLVSAEHETGEEIIKCKLQYHFEENKVGISGHVSGNGWEEAQLVLPVLGQTGRGCVQEETGKFCIPRPDGVIEVYSTDFRGNPQPVFFLAGGFEAWKFVASPDEDGNFHVSMRISDSSSTENHERIPGCYFTGK